MIQSILSKEYGLEELCDIDRDVSECWEELPEDTPEDAVVQVVILAYDRETWDKTMGKLDGARN